MYLYVFQVSRSTTVLTSSEGQVLYKIGHQPKLFPTFRAITTTISQSTATHPNNLVRAPLGFNLYSSLEKSELSASPIHLNGTTDPGDLSYSPLREYAMHIDMKQNEDAFRILGASEMGNLFYPSKLRFGEDEILTKTFFRCEGYGLFGRNHAFTGPDGMEYKWVLGLWGVELRLNSLPVVIAKFHRRRIGLPYIRKARQACIEILPGGEHMADTVVVTFSYVNKLQRQRQSGLMLVVLVMLKDLILWALSGFFSG